MSHVKVDSSRGTLGSTVDTRSASVSRGFRKISLIFYVLVYLALEVDSRTSQVSQWSLSGLTWESALRVRIFFGARVHRGTNPN